MESARRRRRWPWIVLGVVVVLIALVAVFVVPILLHRDGGLSNQEQTGEEFPLSVTASGDDGRDRTLEVEAADGGALDTSALAAGDRVIVHGTGYDASQGIYVAICAIPDDPSVKPGPCLGGVPEQEEQTVEEGAIQYGPSNWINDQWAWRLFGARSYDDPDAGTFTAYIELPEASDENVDCTEVACAIYTRNDHTALNDRVQDVYIPISFAG